MENFQALSKEKQIDFKFESSAVFVDLWVDKDKFEKLYLIFFRMHLNIPNLINQ